MAKRSSALYYVFQLAITTTTTKGIRTSSNSAMMNAPNMLPPKATVIVAEKSFSCSDGVKLAARCWTNFDSSGEFVASAL